MITNQDRFEALVNSKSLLNPKSGFSLFEVEHTDTKLRQEPNSNLVFGKRMEKYFAQYLQASSRYELIEHNIPVTENKITKGELDFIIRDLKEQSIVHLEMACKFYIFDPKISDQSLKCWIGPNRKDSLIHKLTKLKEHQFPLINHPETKKQLNELFDPEVEIQQKLFLPGLLFLPYEYDYTFKVLNKAAYAGFWVTKAQFETVNFEDSQFIIPPKKDWLIAPALGHNWLSLAEARNLIEESIKHHKAPLCWCKTKDGFYRRFFVLES